MGRLMRLSATAGIALAVGLHASAMAFGTLNVGGQSAEHERITRVALRASGFDAASLDALAGKAGTFGAVGAPDRPDRGLLFESLAHCDNGDVLPVPGYPQTQAQARSRLEACRAWMFDHLDRAVEDAAPLVTADLKVDAAQTPGLAPCIFNGRPGRAKCNVLEDLGLAFHAAQDFYSHSNWVDRPDAARPVGETNPPGLGNQGRAPWLDPRRPAGFPAGLMTGCFQLFPESLPGSCVYGGGKARVRHAVLNKDTGPIDVATGQVGLGTTARGGVQGNFARAVLAAEDDTRDKWLYFEEQVRARYGPGRGAKILCVIERDRPADCR